MEVMDVIQVETFTDGGKGSEAVDWGILSLRWTVEARKLPESREKPRVTPSPGRAQGRWG